MLFRNIKFSVIRHLLANQSSFLFILMALAGASFSVISGCKTVEKVDKTEVLHNEIYKSACDDDVMQGCHNLAVNHLKAGDLREARKFFKKACDGGFPPSCPLFRKITRKKNNNK